LLDEIVHESGGTFLCAGVYNFRTSGAPKSSGESLDQKTSGWEIGGGNE
jgi:hypothetical protein